MTAGGPPPARAAIGAAAVVGATAWGTTLAILLARNGLRVTGGMEAHAWISR